EGARPRLQDEHPGRRNARGDRRGRLPAAAPGLCARVFPGGRRRGRGRLPLPRTPRGSGVHRLRPDRVARSRSRALGRDPPDRCRRVRPNSERLHMRRVPGSRPRVCRAESAPAAGAAGRGRMTETPPFEPRWPAAVAVVAAAVLFVTLPDALVPGPPWVRFVIPALELAVLIPLAVTAPH